jgi:hypothetical protein
LASVGPSVFGGKYLSFSCCLRTCCGETTGQWIAWLKGILAYKVEKLNTHCLTDKRDVRREMPLTERIGELLVVDEGSDCRCDPTPTIVPSAGKPFRRQPRLETFETALPGGVSIAAEKGRRFGGRGHWVSQSGAMRGQWGSQMRNWAPRQLAAS